MSNATVYNLEFNHESIDYLIDVLNYLKAKKERWDKCQAEGKEACELMAELGLEKTNEVVSWGFDVTGVTVRLSAWAHENAFNLPISGDEGELADLQEKFPELSIGGSYQNEYTYGAVCGSEKVCEGSVDDEEDVEEEDAEFYDQSEGLGRIDMEVAQQFLTDSGVALYFCTEIDDDAAEAISRYEGSHLVLNGLTKLSDAAAESFSKYRGNLSLTGVTKLSDAAANSFSKHEGWLWLDGLTELSGAAVKALAEHQGDLSLDGLTELSDAAVKALAGHQGDLKLNGLTELSDAAAKSLASHEGELFLNGLTELSYAAAKSLACHQGNLRLYRLTELSDAVAASLSKKKGTINGVDPAEWVQSLNGSENTEDKIKLVVGGVSVTMYDDGSVLFNDTLSTAPLTNKEIELFVAALNTFKAESIKVKIKLVVGGVSIVVYDDRSMLIAEEDTEASNEIATDPLTNQEIESLIAALNTYKTIRS